MLLFAFILELFHYKKCHFAICRHFNGFLLYIEKILTHALLEVLNMRTLSGFISLKIIIIL